MSIACEDTVVGRPGGGAVPPVPDAGVGAGFWSLEDIAFARLQIDVDAIDAMRGCGFIFGTSWRSYKVYRTRGA
jgi:hypothetical protein